MKYINILFNDDPIDPPENVFNFGLEEGYQQLQVGWGCPLEAPINSLTNNLSGILGYINFFLPISELAGILTAWLIAIGCYYIASIVLRWVKAVS